MTYGEAKLKVFETLLPYDGERFRWHGSVRTWSAVWYTSGRMGIMVEVGEPLPMPVSLSDFWSYLNNRELLRV